MEIVVNAAMSLDGKLSSRRREQIAISGEDDFKRVDRLRASVDAVLVGVGTVLADDPQLGLPDAEPPARVVADSTGRTPTDARVLDDTAPSYVLAAETLPADRQSALEAAGAMVITAGTDRVDLTTALPALEEHGVDRVLAEGGGELIYSLIAAELVDELSVFVGPMVIGGRDAPTLVDGEGFVDSFPTATLKDITQLDGGVLLQWEF